jgi:hypothetical protein
MVIMTKRRIDRLIDRPTAAPDDIDLTRTSRRTGQ